jgi:hypothetical protein
MRRTLLALALCLALPTLAEDETRSTAAEQSALAVTIYNADLALVKDARRIKLPKAGENRLAWRDVSARIQPETALLRALDGKPLTLIEQNFDFDLLTPQKLLEKSVGGSVRVLHTHPTSGAVSSETASVLAANEGVVLKFADRVETGVPGRLAFDQVPEGLRDAPTLSMLLDSEGRGFQDFELSYLTGGLSWKADYVAELAAREDQLDLNGWVTLTNVSGAGYRNARLQLVAGEVNRARPERAPMPMMMMEMAKAAPAMQEEALFEYHLYSLPRLTSINDRQTKQVALLSAQKVKCDKEFRLDGGEWYYGSQASELGQKLKPGVFLQFSNKGENLGLPLPKGTVRVYKRDAAGRAQFIGEDRIDHTAKGEVVRLKLGEAFDITADKTQTDFSRISNRVIETAYRLEIRNAKSEPVTVKVVEPLPGDWQITQESLASTKATAHSAVWQVPVAAEGKTVLTWRARIKY